MTLQNQFWVENKVGNVAVHKNEGLSSQAVSRYALLEPMVDAGVTAASGKKEGQQHDKIGDGKFNAIVQNGDGA